MGRSEPRRRNRGQRCDHAPRLRGRPSRCREPRQLSQRRFWNDVDGHRIEAHGAGLLQVGDTWYWVGEDKSANGAGFKAVNCYAFEGSVSWHFPQCDHHARHRAELAAADRIIERPKLIYNDGTHQYVMWLHWEGQNYAEAAAGVFTSDSVDGDYTYRKSFRPNGNMSRDDALFKDDDGKAYFVSAANENADLGLYELTDDYLDVARQISTLFPGSYREAPALFKSNGLYYLITSAATNWDSATKPSTPPPARWRGRGRRCRTSATPRRMTPSRRS